MVKLGKLKIFLALKLSDFVFILLSNVKMPTALVKMPTVVVILTFMSRIYSYSVEHEKSFITSEPVIGTFAVSEDTDKMQQNLAF